MSKKTRIILPVAIVVACAAAAVGIARLGGEPDRREPEQAALLVDAVHPRIHDGPFVVRAQGTVSPRIETDLVAEVAGRITWMSENFVAGGTFKADEVLARIDPSDYETALLAARAELASARATLADEQARSDAAREDFRRLYGDSREPGDLLLRLPQVARAKAAVQAQEAAVARARRDLERTRIRLPFNGMVRERSADLGQFVGTGTSLGTAFSTDRVEVRLPVSQSDFEFLGIPFVQGDREIERPVVLHATIAGRAETWDATLVRTEGVIDQDTRVTYLVAEVVDPYALKPESDHAQLPVGTFVEARIPGRDASGLVVLPSQAIHDGDRIYLAGADDRLEVRSVEIVRSTPREVYVDAALDADARVITTAIPAPVPGLKLNVREVREMGPRLRLLPVDEELAVGSIGAGQ